MGAQVRSPELPALRRVLFDDMVVGLVLSFEGGLSVAQNTGRSVWVRLELSSGELVSVSVPSGRMTVLAAAP